jgi:urea-proton symporter
LDPILSEGIGYVILLGVGLVMAIAVTLLVRVEHKWLGTRKTFEWFYTAGRNVKTGLIAASLVSAWTWAATLLQSSTVAYQYGISGPFWYAAGANLLSSHLDYHLELNPTDHVEIEQPKGTRRFTVHLAYSLVG